MRHQRTVATAPAGASLEPKGRARAARGLRAALTAVVVAVLGMAGGSGAVLAQEPTSFQPQCITATLDNAPHAICNTGAVAGGRITHVRYQKEGTTGSAESSFISFNAAGKVSAVLGVVDRGNRARQRVVSLAAGDVQRLIEAARVAGASHRFGVGQISDRYETLAQIGANREEVARATTAMKADGTVADSGRLLADALRQLTLAQAERHILVLASDGKPEDRAYGREDVIRAARDAKVIVVALAFRDRPDAAGPETGSLRRLAEDTGGLYFDVGSPSGRLDDAAVTRFAQFVGSGGTATFPLARTDPRGRYLVTLEFDSGRSVSGAFFADVPAGAAPPAAPAGQGGSGTQVAQAPAGGPSAGPRTSGGNAPPSGTPGAPAGAQAPPRPPATPPDAPGIMDRSGFDNIVDWLKAEWAARPVVFVAVPAALVLLVAGLVWFQFRRRRSLPVFAWLELIDERRTRVPVTATGVRIGRHSDNDIRFENQSVHRFHAVLSRDVSTGQFVISDVSRELERSNGVLVNGDLVVKAPLANGDTVELGEVRFRFLYA